MPFSIIAAIDLKRGLGQAGTIPWTLKADMKHFRDITVGENPSVKPNAVIMGRTTWLSLPERFRPLPDRLNIVLSDQPIDLPTGVFMAANFDEALRLAAQHTTGEVFVIGGGSVYRQTITHPDCLTVYLTELDKDFGCDTFFPDLPAGFHVTQSSEPLTEKDIQFQFKVYQRPT